LPILSARYLVPAIYTIRDYAEAGGLISYGADVIEVAELQEEQLAIHQQATAAAAANKQVTIESLIAEAEAARAKAMSEKGGAAAAVSALTAKAKLAGMWREKLDQHNTGSPVYERIERVIVERAPQSAAEGIPDESIYDEPSTDVVREMSGRHWSAD